MFPVFQGSGCSVLQNVGCPVLQDVEGCSVLQNAGCPVLQDVEGCSVLQNAGCPVLQDIEFPVIQEGGPLYCRGMSFRFDVGLDSAAGFDSCVCAELW